MKVNFKWSKLAAVSMILILLLAACGGNNSGGKVLNIAREATPDTINNLINEGAENSLIISNFSEGLLNYDQDGKLVGGLAESWDHKGNVYTFKLRDGLKWSNDTPLTANDFVFGWQTLITHPAAPYKFLMENIKNGKAVADGQKPASALGVKALDDRTLEVKMEHDRVYILEMLAHSTFFPLNEAFYKEVGPDNYATSADKVIASGAFILTEYNPDSGYTLEKNPNYWNAANVQLDKANVRIVKESATQETLYNNGELDVLTVQPNLYDKYKDDPKLKSFTTASVYHIYLSGNTATPSAALANADFRQAVNYAIDKKLLTDSVLKNGSVPLDYLVPQGFGDINGKTYREVTGIGTGNNLRFDVNKAKEYLERAKTQLTPNDLQFTIAFGDAETNKLAFENIKSQLETNLPGVKVTLNPIPTATYFKGLARGDTPSAFSGWLPDYRDVATYFQNFITGNSMNYGHYSNPEYDALYNQAENEMDPVKRANYFKEAEELLISDGAIVPLFQRGRRVLINGKVEGFHLNSVSPEIDFRFINIK